VGVEPTVCFADVEWVAFVAGELTPEARTTLAHHLDSCEACRAVAAALAEVPHDETSSVLVDRYELRHELGRGGMGRIVVAYDRQLRREVALKCLREDAANVARFATEISVLSRLQHPAIVPIVDAGALDADFPFFVMPLLQGEPLDKRLRGDLDANARVALTHQLLPMFDAIAYAHEQGILHRDLKPHNVFVGTFGEVVVLDWGLAKERDRQVAAVSAKPLAHGDLDPATFTQTGVALGTPAYASPEQRYGESVDERTDVYGLGAILYHVLGGKPPGAGEIEPLDVLAPDVHKDLAAIVMRALSDATSARYPTARELAADLSRFFAGLLVSAREYSARERFVHFVRRYRTAVVATTAVLVAIVIVSAISIKMIWAERRDALVARDRAQAESIYRANLMRFVLDDVRIQYDSIGRLDLTKALARGIHQIRASAPAGVAATPALSYETALLDAMDGDVAYFERRVADARREFAAVRSAAEPSLWLAESPQDRTDWVLLLCGTQLSLSNLDVGEGDVVHARHEVETCDALLRLANVDRPLLRARVYEERSRLTALEDPARVRLLEAAVAELAIPPASPESQTMWRQNRLAVAVELSDTYRRTGALDKAIAESESLLTLVTQWRQSLPDDANLALANVQISSNLASALAERDVVANHDRIVALLTEAERDGTALRVKDPTNADVLGVLSVVLNARALVTSDPRERLAYQERSAAISKRLLELSPNDRGRREAYAIDLLNLAIELDDRDDRKARQLCGELVPLVSGFGDLNVESQVKSLLVCANVESNRGRRDLAQDERVRAVELGRRTASASQINRVMYQYALDAWLQALPAREAATHIGELLENRDRLLAVPEHDRSDDWRLVVDAAEKLRRKLATN
jgi:serine/threonine protein kinase/tetratricopeptide (TPR) repeat protein